jgi:hypothetical protein
LALRYRLEDSGHCIGDVLNGCGFGQIEANEFASRCGPGVEIWRDHARSMKSHVHVLGLVTHHFEPELDRGFAITSELKQLLRSLVARTFWPSLPCASGHYLFSPILGNASP